ncbi:zf-TFIIB domain-containing protein [Streptomyces acidiscabies]|uniref:Zf-TFIIB domain-containing protein n=1 Tax=Streptomyces acidiscabies TaxID=42234 RepID=A0AAP6B8E3_9ACTN|nr:zf-TFIIB domain-containing protein [Streptomyces acidiscabies]MBP5940753.1 zf-TFIIB domain containing protein [Streptomyces sp. LBUM 1476]MBZ3912033.1 zf-TFIIB domain-containing protein [Streptomyces acidiscabies]MDX2959842.1 zf-TFIIB domain-containing protein [Streptomyces acidiscabies]MDX3022354.1 zf-TFIIB domain-containing protein [Streptomyces acidiscabies]MDX3792480.1 zf-TFIIB domain-containing protein [Streptomyces acidiscabies]
MQCPKCHAAMHTYNRNGVQIEQCSNCRGIFLDYGELEALTRLEGQWGQPGPQAYPAAPPVPPPGPAWGAPQHHGGHGGHHGGHHQRHKSFGHMLFSS